MSQFFRETYMPEYNYYFNCGDYYEKEFTQEQYNDQMNILRSSDNNWIAVDDKGFRVISLIEKVFHVIKSFFGFHSESNAYLINSEILKLLYYGETKGYNSPPALEEWVRSMAAKPHFHVEVTDILNLLLQKAENAAYLKEMERMLLKFHSGNGASMSPFWYSLFVDPTIPVDANSEFGSTYLYLAREAMNHPEEPDFVAAYNHTLSATQIPNPSVKFQMAVATTLVKLIEKCNSVLILKRAQMDLLTISDNLIKNQNKTYDDLAGYIRMALKTNCSTEKFVVKCLNLHLREKQVAVLSNYLETWRELYSENDITESKIADAYWMLDQKKEAATIYQKIVDSRNSHLPDRTLSEMHYRIFEYKNSPGYFSFLTSLFSTFFNSDYNNKIALLEQAIRLNPDSLHYKETLYALCLNAGEQESAKTRLKYDQKLHIHYLLTAYDQFPNRAGPHIETLIHLLLDSKDVTRVLKIFDETRSLPSFDLLTNSDYFLIAKEYLKNSDLSKSLIYIEKIISPENSLEDQEHYLNLFKEIMQKKINAADTKEKLQKLALYDKIIDILLRNKKSYNPLPELEIEKLLLHVSKPCLEFYMEQAALLVDEEKDKEALAAYESIIRDYGLSLKDVQPEILSRAYFYASHYHRKNNNHIQNGSYLKIAHDLYPKNPYYSFYLAGCVKDKEYHYLSQAIACFQTKEQYTQWFSTEFNLWDADFMTWLDGSGKMPLLTN